MFLFHSEKKFSNVQCAKSPIDGFKLFQPLEWTKHFNCFQNFIHYAHWQIARVRKRAMHFTCQPEANFRPIFLWLTVLSHLCKQKSRRLEKILFSFLVYLLLKSDANLCHTPCVIFLACVCLPLFACFPLLLA